MTDRPRVTSQDQASSELRYLQVFQGVKDGVLLIHAKTGDIEDANPRLLKMVGGTMKALRKKKIWEIGFAEGPLSSRAAFKKWGLKDMDSAWVSPVHIGRRPPFFVEFEFAPYRKGQAESLVITIRDITQRQNLEEGLREREELYRKIFDDTDLGIAIIHPRDLRITKINAAFSRMLGYDKDEMKGLTLTDITHPSHLEADKKMMRAVRSCLRSDFIEEKRFIKKGGDVMWAKVHLGAVCLEGERASYFQAVIEDISEHRRVEAELAELNVRNMEKEEAILKLQDEFTFIAAHELRTPVTVIAWNLELMKESVKEGRPEEAASLMLEVDESVRRLKALLNELLEVSRIEFGTIKVATGQFALTDVIGKSVTAVKQAADEKSIVVDVLPPPDDLPAAVGDPDRAFEILTNLLTNAIKYTPAGGRVTVRTSDTPDGIYVSVEDTGFGLSEENLAKLFRKFSRIESDDTAHVPGTGLGLFIVKQLVERMGGRVWAQSAGRGKGSTFTFSLQKVAKSPAGNRPARKDSPKS